MTIKVFIGSEPKTEIARKVLEFSIKKVTPSKVIFPDLSSQDNWTTRDQSQVKGKVGTGFSLLRWAIPVRCNYQGFAIYLDADIICLTDLTRLWECDISYPNPNCSIWCTYQPSKFFKQPTPETSVMLIDCQKAQFNQPNYDKCRDFIKNDPDRTRYVKIMRALKHKAQPQKIPDSFNRLNTFVPNATTILHYTKEPQQPWYHPGHPHRDLWERLLKETIDDGGVTKEEIKEAVKAYQPHTHNIRGTGLHPYWKKYAS